jgi:hypothetical protein
MLIMRLFRLESVPGVTPADTDILNSYVIDNLHQMLMGVLAQTAITLIIIQ